MILRLFGTRPVLGDVNAREASELEAWFQPFRNNIIGNDQSFVSPYGVQKVLYADWIASGRMYRPIEERIINKFGPFCANTHTEASMTGTLMTQAYHEAQKIIKRHVNASSEDAIVCAGSGMTTVINKLQRILGLKVPEQIRRGLEIPENKRPVVFLTHMEHHSNQTSWLETLAEVVVLDPGEGGLVDPRSLEAILPRYEDRPLKIGAFTAASNVTGIQVPVHDLARVMHAHGGYCFVDYACSAPYVPIDMHPGGEGEDLDAIFFSPHKFVGGPGTPGVLVFHEKLYPGGPPDNPGGGTVDWTNPWGGHKYLDSIELREDGGTPGFLQTIKAAHCTLLKDKMDPAKILAREEELLHRCFAGLRRIPRLHVLAGDVTDRLGVISFYIEDIHYNLIVRLLSDRFGIQMRGGCSCAGTYGHYLLNVDPNYSKTITDLIDIGDNSTKPGWVRFSLHPTLLDSELDRILEAIALVEANIESWQRDYDYDSKTNNFVHRHYPDLTSAIIEEWFED